MSPFRSKKTDAEEPAAAPRPDFSAALALVGPAVQSAQQHAKALEDAETILTAAAAADQVLAEHERRVAEVEARLQSRTNEADDALAAKQRALEELATARVQTDRAKAELQTTLDRARQAVGEEIAALERELTSARASHQAALEGLAVERGRAEQELAAVRTQLKQLREGIPG